MHRIHVVLRFETQIRLLIPTEANRGFVLDSEQKLRHSDN